MPDTTDRRHREAAPAAALPVVQVDGHRVGLTVEGDGPPLVLLHGIGRDRTDWTPVVPALADRFTVYAFDIEGFGESDPWGERVSLRSMAAMVRRTLQSLGETRPVRAAGNSMGGAVALRMLADDPSAVAALVLISPAGFGSEAAFGLRLLTVPALGPLLLRFSITAAWLQVRSLVFDRNLATRELTFASARRMRRPGARRRYLDVIHDLGAWGGIRPEWRREVVEALGEAGTPTLVLWGERDVVLPHAHLAAAAESVPHAVTRSLPDLGHSPQLEAPERIAAMITEFLESVA
jgi:pimeloyl-ACP methyl ester carboxylesterase